MKNKETLEEAKTKYLNKCVREERLTGYCDEDFEAGAVWQAERMYSETQMDDAYDKGFKDASQRMYSEKEVIEILRQRSIAMSTSFAEFQEFLFKKDMEWFEKNKKFKK